MKNKIVISILSLLILFNAYIYRNELVILSDANDNTFQYALVHQANIIWQDVLRGKLNPLYLIDHFNERWSEGFSLAMYYSHLPQAILSLPGLLKPDILYPLFNFVKYLMLVMLPLSFYWGGKRLGGSSTFALAAAFFSHLIFTNGLYGIDSSSFLWRGWGLSSQLFAVFFLPLAFGYAYKYLSAEEEVRNGGALRAMPVLIKAVFFNFLVAQSHSGVFLMLAFSYIALFLCKLVLEFRLDSSKWISLRRFFVFSLILFFVLSYFLIPFFLYANYRGFSYWDNIWKFESFPWRQIFIWVYNGEIFDYNRFPFISLAAAAGFFIAFLSNKRTEFLLSVLFGIYFVLYLGKAAFGGIFDLIPGLSEFHLHRFVVMVQFIGIYLAATTVENIKYQISKIKNILRSTQAFGSEAYTAQARRDNTERSRSITDQNSKIFKTGLIVILILVSSLMIYFAEKPVIKYARENNSLILESNKKYLQDKKEYLTIVNKLKLLPKARIYAGRPGNWGRNLIVGSTQMYMALSNEGFPVIGFAPESWSPNSEYDQFFNENDKEDYDFYNVRYIVAPLDFKPPVFARQLEKTSKYALYGIDTDGWFSLGTSAMGFASDKKHYINVTRLWMDSYHRVNKEYPSISFDRYNLSGSRTNFVMSGESLYTDESGKTRTLWQKNPFETVYPASPSAKIVSKKEETAPQAYSATIKLDRDCPDCILVLKNTFHPNWEVKINGEKADTFPIFPFYIGIPFNKAGENRVTAVYTPGTIKTLLVTLELIFLGYFTVRYFVRRNR